jgi:hypothetical protein
MLHQVRHVCRSVTHPKTMSQCKKAIRTACTTMPADSHLPLNFQRIKMLISKGCKLDWWETHPFHLLFWKWGQMYMITDYIPQNQRCHQGLPNTGTTYVTQHPPVHHPLKTHEPQLSYHGSTLLIYREGKPYHFPITLSKYFKWVCIRDK